MALPSTAIDQLRRDPASTPGWSGNLLMFSSTVLFVSVIAFLGLSYGYEPYLQKQIANLKSERKQVSQQVSASDQAKIIQFYSQLANIKKLLASHAESSRVFDFVEARTLQSVYFERATMNTANRDLQLAGKTRSMQDVGLELQVFQKDPLIEKVTLRSSAVDSSGMWSFDMDITMSPALLSGTAAVATTTTQ